MELKKLCRSLKFYPVQSEGTLCSGSALRTMLTYSCPETALQKLGSGTSHKLLDN